MNSYFLICDGDVLVTLILNQTILIELFKALKLVGKNKIINAIYKGKKLQIHLRHYLCNSKLLCAYH